MRRSLIHYWPINLAVLLGAAVATAVLTGALLVGDSVRGSLRDLTLDRLGGIDYALVAQRYFREDLLVELALREEVETNIAAMASAIITNGSAVHAKSKARASRINVYAVDEQFFSFYETQQNAAVWSESLGKRTDQAFPSIVVNEALQNELQAAVGDQILLAVARPSEIARGSLLGSKDTEDVVETARFTLAKIIPDRGPGRFTLRPNQNVVLSAFVSLPVLQKALGVDDQINAILAGGKSEVRAEDLTGVLQSNLRDVLTSEDLGLKYEFVDSVFSLESRESILSPQLVRLAESVAQEMGLLTFSSYIYLANRMEVGNRLLPYSTVAALKTPVSAPFQSLTLTSGQPAPSLAENEILVNEWAADDLRVRSGDEIRMTYFGVGARDELFTAEANFKVAGIVAMTGLAADKQLTPDFPGIADADNMADWDPPFPVELGLIRPRDEVYWDQYRGVPKAFVSESTGQKLWGTRFGKVTSLRMGASPNADVAETQEQFEQELLAQAKPEEFDLAFQPVKKQGLDAAGGAINFAEYFVYFSFFLIVSAALLVGLLFRLGVEQRAGEIGMLLAVGYPVAKVRRGFLQEGLFLAVFGIIIGLGGALLYAWLLMVGLRTWWVAAVGSPFLYLHINPVSLLIGFVGSIAVIVLSIWLGFRKVSKIPPPRLLAGNATAVFVGKVGRTGKVIASVCLTLAALLTLSTVWFEGESSAGLFFGVGGLLLVVGLALFSVWLRGSHRPLSAAPGFGTALRMAARNSPRSPGRSMLSAALVACACFVIISVESFRRDFGEELLQKTSGAGGFTLIAETDIPLHHDLSSEDGRFELGFSDDDSEFLKQAEIMPFRLRPGDDASCLNLFQVENPRIVGVTETQIARGGFKFQKVEATETNGPVDPWNLLNKEIAPNVIPAFGDQNSVTYILHSGFGKDFVMTDEFGEEIRLRFVGLLEKSIFQSELLISEQQFLKHFPSQNGYGYFLITTLPESTLQSAQILESSLSDYGLDATTTAEKLASFQAVENTYLSTFQALGGLGLILGTVGLGIILIRNIIERRGELATLRAFGFRRATLALLVLGENGFLLLLGILIGGVSATIAVAPHILGEGSQVPWLSLGVMLLLVFCVGMLSSSAAVRTALRIPLLPALKSE